MTAQDSRVTRYLLGKLPEQEADALASEMFTDDETFSAMGGCRKRPHRGVPGRRALGRRPFALRRALPGVRAPAGAARTGAQPAPCLEELPPHPSARASSAPLGGRRRLRTGRRGAGAAGEPRGGPHPHACRRAGARPHRAPRHPGGAPARARATPGRRRGFRGRDLAPRRHQRARRRSGRAIPRRKRLGPPASRAGRRTGRCLVPRAHLPPRRPRYPCSLRSLGRIRLRPRLRGRDGAGRPVASRDLHRLPDPRRRDGLAGARAVLVQRPFALTAFPRRPGKTLRVL